MTHTVPVRRGIAEAALIVFSVLLAFWIDAWWEERQARASEVAAVQAVRAELAQNRSQLELRIDQNRQQLAVLERFLGTTPRELGAMSPDSVQLFAGSMAIAPTFDPELAAATVLSNSTILTSPRDAEVRRLVATWVREIADAEEDRAVFHERTFRVVDALAGYVAAHVGPGSIRAAESVVSRNLMVRMVATSGPQLLARLREDDAFAASVLGKAHTQSEYATELERALQTLDGIARTLSGDLVN